jgi:hypothetical protein
MEEAPNVHSYRSIDNVCSSVLYVMFTMYYGGMYDVQANKIQLQFKLQKINHVPGAGKKVNK